MSIVRTFLLLVASVAAWGQPAPGELQYSPERMRLAVELRTRTQILHFVEAGWDIALLVLLVRFGMASRMRARRVVTVAAILAIVALAGLPFSLYRHSLALRYGLSIQAWGSWLWDWAKGSALTGAVLIPLLTAGFALARRVRNWWIWAWAGTVAVMLVVAFLVPILVDPMFNNFRPLSERHPDLIPKLGQVSARAGLSIPPGRMFEMEASEKSRAVNAYLTGFGASKRIVLWDTTMSTLTPEQVQTVFAHEAGHYVLHHVPKGLAIAAIALLFLIYALNRVLGRGAGDPASLPKALLFLAVVSFLAEPAANAYSRWQEQQADVFELDVMNGLVPDEGQNAAQVDLIMAEINLEHPRPNPFVVWWLYDHPPSAKRIHFALHYYPPATLKKF